MFVNNYIFSNSSLDILPSSSPFKKRKIYYETTIKKKFKDNFSIFNNSNLLINALRNFAVRYELDDKKILKDYKFVIAFDDLISLIRYSLESQKTLNEFEIEETNKINGFTKDFINTISNYINSYEKVEKINPLPKNKYKNKFILNKANINFNSNKVNNKKSSSIIKSPSCWIDLTKTQMNLNPKKGIINQNNKNNLKNSKNTNNVKLSTLSTRTNKTKKDENLNDEQNYTNTYFKRKKYKNSLTLFSPKNKSKAKENTLKVSKSRLNKSAQGRRNKHGYFTETNNNNNGSNNFNRSTFNRKTFDDEKNDGRKMSIFTACEYLRSSSFILKNINKESLDNKEKKLLNYNSNDLNNEMKLDNEKKVVYHNGESNLGFKKKFFNKKAPRPSNFANKLLQKGIKFIADFNGLKEEEQKKKYY